MLNSVSKYDSTVPENTFKKRLFNQNMYNAQNQSFLFTSLFRDSWYCFTSTEAGGMYLLFIFFKLH